MHLHACLLFASLCAFRALAVPTQTQDPTAEKMCCKLFCLATCFKPAPAPPPPPPPFIRCVDVCIVNLAGIDHF
jgi:hypothetical protein